jgi:hypothetical protein
MSNIRIIHPKRHWSRAWEFTRYWQTVLAKRPQRSPSYVDDGLTAEDVADLPERLRMPTTRVAINAMKMGMRKDRHERRTKTVRAEKFWKSFGHPKRKRVA